MKQNKCLFANDDLAALTTVNINSNYFNEFDAI